jgi:BirA family biotin operon repressor/biotin-[acetyl-CoA-carboxylase] ligase
VTEIRRHDILDSTNEEARRLAANGEGCPLWIVAKSQTEGRGRRGRSWISQPGNLFASLLIELSAPPERCAELSFVAALGVADLVSDYAPEESVTLKWPNDVLLNGRKLAGVLLESVPNGPAIHLIVGFGVNLAHNPEKTDFPAASLAGIASEAPDPEAALLRLVEAWNKWYEIWCQKGFEPIRSEWLARAYGVGKKLTVNLGNAVVTGIFETIEGDGSLLLKLETGDHRRITAGDVVMVG